MTYVTGVRPEYRPLYGVLAVTPLLGCRGFQPGPNGQMARSNAVFGPKNRWLAVTPFWGVTIYKEIYVLRTYLLLTTFVVDISQYTTVFANRLANRKFLLTYQESLFASLIIYKNKTHAICSGLTLS